MADDRTHHRERESVDAQRHRVDALDHLALLLWAVGRNRLQVRAGGEEKSPSRPAYTSARGGSTSTLCTAATRSRSSSRSSALAGGRSTANTAMPYVSVKETRSTFENPRRPARGGRLRWTRRSVLQIISAGNAQRAPVDVSATNWSSCPPRLAKTDPLRPARPIRWSRGAPGSSIGRTSVNGAGAALPRDQLVIPVE